MFQTKRQVVSFLSVMLFVYLLAWVIQDTLFLNWDVSQLIHAARLMLAGGKYGPDYFTPNPPMILYLYMPPIVLSKMFHLDFLLIFRGYIFAIGTLSLFLSYLLACRIFSKEDNLIGYVFLVTIAILFFILPLFLLGQRDHLLLMFLMPYFLVVTLRLQGDVVSLPCAVMVGLFVGLGVSLKPQFLFAPLFVELYYSYCKKSWLAWVRTEIVVSISIAIIYGMILFVFYQDYIVNIAPYLIYSYRDAVGVPMDVLLSRPVMIFCYFSLAFYLVCRRESRYAILNAVLFLALLGFMASYLSQGTLFSYHLIPALAIAILLSVLIFVSFAKKYRHIFTLILGVMILAYPLYYLCDFYGYGVLYKRGTLNRLIAFMQTQPPHQSIAVISGNTNDAAPLMDYFTDIKYAQRFDCLWMVSGLMRLAEKQGDALLRRYIRNNKDSDFFLNQFSDDMHQNKPNLIWVDIKKSNAILNGYYTHFDFLSYFLENEKFKKEWKSYRYLTTVESGMPNFDYKMQVYERIKE